jgi:serine phosphatase RsbU (regulator of sigma subunit)
VPELADWGTVLIRGDGDELEQLAAAHVDPAKIGLLHEFGERRPTRMSDSTGPAEVIRSGSAVLVREVTDELLARIEPPENQLALVAELGIRSIVIVPIAIPGQPPIGTLTLVMAESGRLFSEDDMALAEELGRRAAIAIENARLYTERSRIATTLERSLLPAALPNVPGFRLAGLYRPAGDQNEVGGDFYDVFEVPGGWMFVVGDVAGRGAEAATLTSLSRYTLRAVAKLVGDPLLALRQLNAALRERPELSLVSVCCAMLRESDTGAEVSVLLAGHPPAYRIHNGEGQQVGSFAPFLGAQDDAPFQAATVALEPGDQLVLYTDGVLDTVGQTERFGEDRLAEALRDGHNAADTMRRIEEALGRFAAGPQVDDTAVLVLERANGSERP